MGYLTFDQNESNYVSINLDLVQNIEYDRRRQELLVVWANSDRGCSTYKVLDGNEMLRALNTICANDRYDAY